jgi:hypothetical protein
MKSLEYSSSKVYRHLPSGTRKVGVRPMNCGMPEAMASHWYKAGIAQYRQKQKPNKDS